MADTMAIYIYTHAVSSIVRQRATPLFFFLPLCSLSSPHLTMPSNESPPFRFNIRNNGFLVRPARKRFFTLSSSPIVYVRRVHSLLLELEIRVMVVFTHVCIDAKVAFHGSIVDIPVCEQYSPLHKPTFHISLGKKSFPFWFSCNMIILLK